MRRGRGLKGEGIGASERIQERVSADQPTGLIQSRTPSERFLSYRRDRQHHREDGVLLCRSLQRAGAETHILDFFTGIFVEVSSNFVQQVPPVRSHWKKILVITVSVVFVFAASCMAMGYIFLGDMCGDEMLGKFVSPNKHFVAEYYIRDCGATTDWVTRVDLKGNGILKYVYGSKPVYAIDGRQEYIFINWISKNELSIQSGATEGRSYVREWRGIKIQAR